MSYIEREPLLEILKGFYDYHLTMHNYSADGATQDCIEAVIEAPAVDIKSKLAREIFEEIEKCTIRKVVRDGEIVYDTTEYFAELKKKYTESEKDK